MFQLNTFYNEQDITLHVKLLQYLSVNKGHNSVHIASRVMPLVSSTALSSFAIILSFNVNTYYNEQDITLYVNL